jgi:hypothetical protein
VPYRIKDRQREAAKRIGVTIRPSSDPSKKIDVYKDGFFVARIGAAGYDDFASYLQQEKKGIVAPGTAENVASCILFAMPKTGLKRELQAITPLKFFGNESA